MLDREGQSVAQYEGMLDAIGQLADIAGPDMALEDRQRLRLDHEGAGGSLRARVADEVIDERRDVVEPITQRRDRHLEGVDAEEKVLAERAGRHHLLEGPVGGTNHPDVDGDRVVVTDATDLAALQGPEKTGLEGSGELTDLVEEQRPTVGHLEQAGAVLLGTGKRPLPVAKQLALHQMLGERAAVDGHEGPRGPGAAVMDRPGDELLAGPRFAAHQHARIARGHPGNEPAHGAEPRRTADETRCSLCPSHPPLERPEPERQLAFLPHPFQHGLDLGKLARLGEVVEHPLTDGRHG